MTRFLLASSFLVLAACGGGASDEGQSDAATRAGAPASDVETREVLAEARACEGGEPGEFEFSVEGLTALGDPLVFNSTMSQAFMEAARAQTCVVTLQSGLSLRIDRPVDDDSASSPASGDRVTVHYEGQLMDGQVFDSSYARNEPATFPSDRLIQGWVEALPLMRVGEAWTLFIPAELAYGERGTPGGPIGPNQALMFRLELLDLPVEEAQPETPEDAADEAEGDAGAGDGNE